MRNVLEKGLLSVFSTCLVAFIYIYFRSWFSELKSLSLNCYFLCFIFVYKYSKTEVTEFTALNCTLLHFFFQMPHPADKIWTGLQKLAIKIIAFLSLASGTLHKSRWKNWKPKTKTQKQKSGHLLQSILS